MNLWSSSLNLINLLSIDTILNNYFNISSRVEMFLLNKNRTKYNEIMNDIRLEKNKIKKLYESKFKNMPNFFLINNVVSNNYNVIETTSEPKIIDEHVEINSNSNNNNTNNNLPQTVFLNSTDEFTNLNDNENIMPISNIDSQEREINNERIVNTDDFISPIQQTNNQEINQRVTLDENILSDEPTDSLVSQNISSYVTTTTEGEEEEDFNIDQTRNKDGLTRRNIIQDANRFASENTQTVTPNIIITNELTNISNDMNILMEEDELNENNNNSNTNYNNNILENEIIARNDKQSNQNSNNQNVTTYLNENNEINQDDNSMDTSTTNYRIINNLPTSIINNNNAINDGQNSLIDSENNYRFNQNLDEIPQNNDSLPISTRLRSSKDESKSKKRLTENALNVNRIDKDKLRKEKKDKKNKNTLLKINEIPTDLYKKTNPSFKNSK